MTPTPKELQTTYHKERLNHFNELIENENEKIKEHQENIEKLWYNIFAHEKAIESLNNQF